MHKIILLLIIGVAIGTVNAVPFSATQLLSDWTQQANPHSNSSGTWGQSNGTLTSPDSGLLLSDFVVNGDFTFSGRMRTTSADDDIMGFTFGFQDNANNYRFAWDSFDNNNGFSDALGTNGVANSTGLSGGPSGSTGAGGNVHGIRLLKEINDTNTFLFQDPGPSGARRYDRGVSYDFVVQRQGNNISFTLDEVGGGNLVNQNFTDSTYLNGRLGLYSSSQPVLFENIDIEIGSVPEPSSILLFGLAAGFLALRRRK